MSEQHDIEMRGLRHQFEEELSKLTAERDRLQEAKRRTLNLADERAKEASALREQLVRARGLMQSMLDQLPIGATIMFGDKVLDHDILSMIRNEIRAEAARMTLSDDQKT